MQIILTEEEYKKLKTVAENAKMTANDELRWKYSEIMDKTFKEMAQKYPDEFAIRRTYDSILLFWNKVKEEVDKSTS